MATTKKATAAGQPIPSRTQTKGTAQTVKGFTTKRDELVSKLKLLSLALSAQPVIEVFQCFVFNGKTATAYNDVVGMSVPCEAGSYAINGPTLLGLLENSAGDEANFVAEDTHVVIKSGRSTFKLPFLGEDAFLFEEPTNWPHQMAISEAFIHGLEAALLTTGKDLAQPAFMGVCLLRDKRQMALFSCDGDGMTKAPIGKGGPDLRLMMPRDFCESVLKVIEGMAPGKTNLFINDEWIMAKLGDYCVYGRLMEIDDPLDYDDLIEKTLKGTKPTYIKVPAGLEAALTRAQVITKLETVQTLISIDSSKPRMTLLTENKIGTVRDAFKFPDHPDAEASVSAELSARAIKLCPEMSVHANCVAYRHPDTGLFVLVSNMEQ